LALVPTALVLTALVPTALVLTALVLVSLVLVSLVLASLVLASLVLVSLVLASLVLSRGYLQRRDGAGAVLNDPFERARAALVEIEPASHRFQPHLEALHLDARPRQLHHEIVDHLVVQRIELLAARLALRVPRVQLRLDVQRLDQRVRVEKQLQERPEERSQPADRAPVRLVEGVFAEGVIGRRRFRRADPPVLLEEARPHPLRVDELLELHVRQLADLFLGIVHAAFLPDPRADLPHDLLDVDVLGTD
jgi:hypothetical protein